MEYRKATLNDVPTLADLRKQQLLEEGIGPIADIDREMREYFASRLHDGSFISWLAVDGTNVVATSGLCFYALPPTFSNPSGQIAYVTNMYTKPEYRKRGISSHLLSLILDVAKMRGYRVARLHTSQDGRSLYVKAGFRDSNGYMSLNLP